MSAGPGLKKLTLRRRFLKGYVNFLWYMNIPVLLIGIGLALWGLRYSVELYKNLRTDMEELLPETAASVQDLKKVSKRVGGLNHLSVIIEGPHPEKVLQAQIHIADELRKLPPSLVARVENNILKEKAFFEHYKGLYIDLEDWQAIDEYATRRIAWERAHASQTMFNIRGKRDPKKLGQPQFDFKALEEKYRKRTEGLTPFQKGYFQSADGHRAVILAFLPGKTTDEKANEKLSDAAREIVNKMNLKKIDPFLEVGYSGDVRNMIEEHEGLIEDLELSTVVVLVLVAVSMLVYFRTFWGVYALCAALFCGSFLTFGLTYFVVGYLNANTAFLGSIVIGNGINFGIIMLARYLEVRRRVDPPALDFEEMKSAADDFQDSGVSDVPISPDALPAKSKGMDARAAVEDAISYTGASTAVAAAAAGLSYMSLMITDFRGFNQFGIIGGLGMLLCWTTTFTIMPALLLFFEARGLIKLEKDIRPWRKFFQSQFVKKVVSFFFNPKEAREIRNSKSLFHWLSLAIPRHAKKILLATVILTALCLVQIRKLGPETLESDFSKLRNIHSLNEGAGFWGKKVDAVFGRYLTPTAVVTEKPEESKILAKELRRLQDLEGPRSPFGDIKIIEDFLPTQQREKIAHMEHLRSLLTPQILKHMNSHDRARVNDLLPKEKLNEITIEDFPPALKIPFKEMDGSVGKMVHVFPQLKFWDGREVVRFAKTLRKAIRDTNVKGLIAGQPPLSADMIDAISTDGPRATLAAILAVTALVIMIFLRRFDLIVAVLSALFLGVLWMAGFMATFELKVNFLNFIALPITFGIGVDYSVNIFSRYRIDQDLLGDKASVADAIRHTGGAVALCSWTTVIGYGSLMAASSQAFVSFGRLAVLGELTCLLAATLSLPALWAWREVNRKRRVRT